MSNGIGLKGKEEEEVTSFRSRRATAEPVRVDDDPGPLNILTTCCVVLCCVVDGDDQPLPANCWSDKQTVSVVSNKI
jgi:hypothetical protein